jgi:hypothetical protein
VQEDRESRKAERALAASGQKVLVYAEGAPELAAYIVSALLLIGLGVWLTSIVLNWIVGPALAVFFVLVLTPVCRRAQARWALRRGDGA